MITVDPHSVALAIASVRERIRIGAHDRPVELIAVTKGFGVDAIEAAVASGCAVIGENYAQELREKMAALPADIEMPQVHFIGQLQTNKVRLISGHVNVWQSVDRRSLADEIARRSPGASIFVQVNTTAEASKGGCNPGETAALVSYCRSLDLTALGLMTIGPTSGDTAMTRDAFAWLRHSADDLGLASCSMGMSDDLEIALEQGATHVRIGSALFGERPRQRAQMK